MKVPTCTIDQTKALVALVKHGEAIRQHFFYQADGLNIGALLVVHRLAEKGFARLDFVGQSCFATPTEKGRKAVATLENGK